MDSEFDKPTVKRYSSLAPVLVAQRREVIHWEEVLQAECNLKALEREFDECEEHGVAESDMYQHVREPYALQSMWLGSVKSGDLREY